MRSKKLQHLLRNVLLLRWKSYY